VKADHQAAALTRFRHPDILHMVEPLEESRSELTFVTEVITSSLGDAIAKPYDRESKRRQSRRADQVVELDEVEIQKGTLQLARALGFLHQQAKMAHLNLSLDAVVITDKVCFSKKLFTSREIGS
jgi:SCY1-like protein 2